MALFGIGGGAFVVPALDAAFYAIPNQAHPSFQIVAIGSLTAIFIGSLPRAAQILSVNSDDRKICYTLLASAIPLIAVCGSIAPLINEQYLRLGFGMLIAVIGTWMLLDKQPTMANCNSQYQTTNIKIIVIGAIAGTSSTFFGLGGATLLTPLMTIWAGLPLGVCINVSILFVAITSVFSLSILSYSWIKFHGTDEFNLTIFTLILLMGLAAAISQSICARIVTKIDDSLRKKLLGIYLLSLSFWMTYRTLYT